MTCIACVCAYVQTAEEETTVVSPFGCCKYEKDWLDFEFDWCISPIFCCCPYRKYLPGNTLDPFVNNIIRENRLRYQDYRIILAPLFISIKKTGPVRQLIDESDIVKNNAPSLE